MREGAEGQEAVLCGVRVPQQLGVLRGVRQLLLRQVPPPAPPAGLPHAHPPVLVQAAAAAEVQQPALRRDGRVQAAHVQQVRVGVVQQVLQHEDGAVVGVDWGVEGRKRDAIRQYPSLICCEEHMTWHVMNCDGVEGMTPIIDRECMRNGHYAKSGIVNDMLF